MKLNEIMKLNTYEPDLAVLDAIITNPSRTAIDHTENKVVYRTELNGNTIFDIDGQAMLVGKMFKFKNNDAYRVGYIVVRPEARRKGYATALYVSLVNRLRLTLVSDDHLTDGSLAVWRAVAKVCHVKSFNQRTGEERSIDTVEQAVDNTLDTLLIARNESLIPEVTGAPIMEQPEKFTHPSNNGLWE